MPAFDKRIGDFDKANTQVLGISTDSPFSHDNWAKSVGISHYPLLSDMHRSVAKDYGVHMADMNINSRATFIVDKTGKVRYAENTARASCRIPTRSWARSRSFRSYRHRGVEA